jgi:hypothetical protein
LPLELHDRGAASPHTVTREATRPRHHASQKQEQYQGQISEHAPWFARTALQQARGLGSAWGDTADDAEVLDMLKTWNETGDIKLDPPPRMS